MALPSLPPAQGLAAATNGWHPPTIRHAGPLQLAIASLATGAGPSRGVAWQCATAGSSASCSTARGLRPAVAAAPHWVRVASTPSVRSNAMMAYDAADGYVVLFGGLGGFYSGGFVLLNDTWAYSGGGWTQLHPAVVPSTRYSASMAYDAKDGYVLLYGGASNGKPYSDTWRFSGGNWTNLAIPKNPGPLYNASMAYDANDSVVVLFGGTNSSGFQSRYTWTYSGGNWTKPFGFKGKPGLFPRSGSQISYDARHGWVTLFGGAGGTLANDTWTFSGGNWTHRVTSPAPPARYGGAFAYDPLTGKLVLFGGVPFSGRFLSDTWTLLDRGWTHLTPAFHPSSRAWPSVVDGGPGGPILVFGGQTSSFGKTILLNDTWSFGHGVWKRVVAAAPAPRLNAALTYDEADGVVLLFGGWVPGTGATYGDTWEFAGGVWRHLPTAVAPSGRIPGAMAYDGTDGYVVLFGGVATPLGSALGDTWTFSNGTWTQLLLGSVHPSGRKDVNMVYDAADGYLLLYGGYNSSTGALNDTWTFAYGAWSQIFPKTTPRADNSAGFAYDSVDGYVLLFGGSDATYYYNDTWIFQAGQWSAVPTLLAPSERAVLSLVDDSRDGCVLLFGGIDGGGNAYGGSDLTDTWTYTNGVWKNITAAAGAPSPVRQYQAAVFDAADGVTVLFGGQSGVSPYRAISDTWLY